MQYLGHPCMKSYSCLCLRLRFDLVSCRLPDTPSHTARWDAPTAAACTRDADGITPLFYPAGQAEPLPRLRSQFRNQLQRWVKFRQCQSRSPQRGVTHAEILPGGEGEGERKTKPATRVSAFIGDSRSSGDLVPKLSPAGESHGY